MGEELGQWFSSWDLIKFPYFADTTERGDSEWKQRGQQVQERMTLRMTLMYNEFVFMGKFVVTYVICFHATDKDIFGCFIVIKPYPKRWDMRQPDNLRNKIYLLIQVVVKERVLALD
jgi:hypothetical protein